MTLSWCKLGTSGSDDVGDDDNEDDDDEEEENEEDGDANETDNVHESAHERNVREAEAKLHRSLASVSSAIDSKQRLLAELQSKAAQLDQLRKHYERQLDHLQSRIKETERERDSVLANLDQLEHAGEERLRRTREEFAKKLSSLQVRCLFPFFMILYDAVTLTDTEYCSIAHKHSSPIRYF